MGNKEYLGMLAMISFLTILFTEQGENTWKFLFFCGIIFSCLILW